MINEENSEQTFSVSQLNRQVKRLLESHFSFVWVEGEISNFVQPGSGHWYFSLKDDAGQVRCAMFRNRNQRVQIKPGNSQQVRIRARVSLYEGRGEFQLIVEHMETAGAGALQLAFEQLKQKLSVEGLFDSERKRPLPEFPTHIGIVTSPTGAAIRDIVSVFQRRFPAIQLSILPVAVQGEESAPAIVKTLEHANSIQPGFDALILARGGGSIEDLWSFNEESVARAVAASKIPTVSAVGHEIDFTICDFVADLRAPTPSAAAELLSPDCVELSYQFANLDVSLQRAQRTLITHASQQLKNLSRLLRHPGDLLQDQYQRLDQLELSLKRCIQNRLKQHMQSIIMHRSSVSKLSPAARLTTMRTNLVNLDMRVKKAAVHSIENLRRQTEKYAALLASLGPQATLKRGYAIVSDAQGRVIQRFTEVHQGDELHTRLASGKLVSTVSSTDGP